MQLRADLRESLECRTLATRRAGERAWALAHPGPASYGSPPGPPPPLSALPAEAQLANPAFLWTVEQNLGPHAVDGGEWSAAATDALRRPSLPDGLVHRKRQATQAGTGFTKLFNGFAATDDLARSRSGFNGGCRCARSSFRAPRLFAASRHARAFVDALMADNWDGRRYTCWR